MAKDSIHNLLNDIDNILKSSASDQRFFKRFAVNLRFRFTIFYDSVATKTDTSTKQGLLQNISQGGACFHTKENLNRGALCRLILSLKDRNMEVRRLLRVLRVKRISGKYEIGGQFVDEKLDPKLERRKSQRRKARITVDYAFPDEEHVSKGVVLNISPSGILIESASSLSKDDIIRVNLGSHPGSRSQLILYGKVIRVSTRQGKQCAGIAFIDYNKYLAENQRVL